MKIALLGYGKMGKAIDELAQAAGDETVLRVSSGNAGRLTAQALHSADVAIEFSRPETAFGHIRLCLEAGVPVVSGTTGWLSQMEEAKQICARLGGAFFYASNFSIGVNIFFALNRYLGQMMARQQQYDVEIEEVHHTQKLDAPSGTAITLAEALLEQLPGKEHWVGQGPAGPSALRIASRREGSVPGTHTVTYTSALDAISIRHEAFSREGFARGALQAARWLVGRKGFYGMEDMLGLLH